MQKTRENAPLTTELVQQINALVIKHTGAVYNTPLGTVDASKGEWRKGNVSAGGFYFINYDKVPSYTKSLVEKINKNKTSVSTLQQKLELSFAAHFDLVSIHALYDGNGRTSRLLMNYLQAALGLPLAIVYKEDKADYLTALQTARKEESLQSFYHFMYNQYTQYLQQEISLFKKKGQNQKPSSGNGYSLFF